VRYQTREVDIDATMLNLWIALASLLLNIDGGVRPYLVYQYDPQRRVASQRHFRASSSSPPALHEVPARPIWPPPRTRLSGSWPFQRRVRSGSMPCAAREGRRRWAVHGFGGAGGEMWGEENSSQPTSAASIDKYKGRCGHEAGLANDLQVRGLRRFGPGPKKHLKPQIRPNLALRSGMHGLLELL
jgi:hypothetical protein